MSEFVTSVRFKADGTDGLVGQLSAAEKQTQKLGTTVDQLSRNLAKEATESKQAAAALNTLDGANDRVAAGSVRTNNAINTLTKSAGQQRAAFQQLGFQIQDVTQGLAMGISPMTIFAQQGGQVAFAMSNMGGKVGAVASFFTGPWGAALLGAGTIALALATSLGNVGDEADTAKDAADRFSDAIRDLDQATGLANKSAERSIQLSAARVRQIRDEEIKTRKLTEAKLADAIVEAERARGDATGGRALNYGAAGIVVAADQRIERLNKLLASQNEKVGELNRSLRGEGYAGALAAAEAATDKAAAATQRYDRELQSVRDRIESGALSQAGAQREIQAIIKRRDAAVEAARAEGKADTEAKRAAAKAAREAAAEIRKLEAANKKAALETERFDKSMHELARSLREAETAEFASQVDRLTRAYDPLQAAAEDYRKELELIDKLLGRGQINQQQAGRFRRGANEKLLDDLDSELEAEFGKAGKEAGAAFNREALARAEAIGQIIGGTAGDALTTVIGLISGASTGDFTAIGGRTGGFATILADVFGGKNSPFVTGLKDIFNPLKDGLKDIGGDIASALGIKGGAGGLGQIAGRAAGGAAIGAGVSGILGGSSLGGSLGGALGGALGGELLGSLGSFAGPVGSIVGAIGGSLIGSLLKGNKTAGAVITGPGNARIGGADTAAYGTAGDLGSAVTSGLDQIAQALGGTLTAGGITAIGTRGGEFRVNTTGDSLKGKNGARGFGDDSAAAVAFALADRISDGAITGISQKVAQALRSSSDIDSAVQEAVKVKAIEELLAGILNPFETAINEFEGQMAERLRIGRQYGFDLVALEEQNNKERLALQEQLLRTQVGSIQDFLDDLSFGDLFQGSSVEKRNQLLTEIDAARGAAEEGQAGAADRLAGLLRNLVSTSRDAFGTAGGFASDVNLARTTGEGIVSEAQRQLDEAVKQTQLQDEANDQLSQIRTGIEQTNEYLKSLNLNGGGFGPNGLTPYRIASSL
jgi:hypothetical protein|tara:strand:- start:2188 stop:5169 length:2982 start_codon:yes stop_codon:yes gene_type:complete